MRKIITKEIEDEIVNRYISGETARSIAKDYPEFNENTISRHIRERGVSRGKGKKLEYISLEKTIIDEYQKDKYATCCSLGEKYGVNDRTISNWLKKNDIKIKGMGKVSHCNEEYFEKIDDPNKAYLLGFITADGAVTYYNNKATLAIEINNKDIDLLHYAAQQINPDATIFPIKNKNNVRIGFCSTKLCNDLNKFGIVQNKSKTIKRVPVELIPDELLPYYFRGLIDGDGCIHKNGAVSIYSGSLEFISDVQKILIDRVNLKSLKIYSGTSYFITWSSRADREKIFHYLYDNLNQSFYYKRKYERLYNSLYDNTVISN